MKRYDLIDTLRGLAIISMIAFHTCWLMNYFGLGVPTQVLYGTMFLAWERSICISFITIAGFSFSLGHHHLRSGLVISALGLAITVVTCVFLPDIRIVFGVLTFIGAATLLMIPLDKISSKTVKDKRMVTVMLFLCLALFLLTYDINRGFIGLFRLWTLRLPEYLYKGYPATFAGFMEPGFISADYFSLMPWFFLYLCGYFIHKLASGAKGAEKILSAAIPGIRAIGRHSLVIYMVHPIVIFAVLYFVSKTL